MRWDIDSPASDAVLPLTINLVVQPTLDKFPRTNPIFSKDDVVLFAAWMYLRMNNSDYQKDLVFDGTIEDGRRFATAMAMEWCLWILSYNNHPWKDMALTIQNSLLNSSDPDWDNEMVDVLNSHFPSKRASLAKLFEQDIYSPSKIEEVLSYSIDADIMDSI